MNEFLLGVLCFLLGQLPFEPPVSCNCTAWFQQVGGDVDIQCDGDCLGSDDCAQAGFDLAGDLIVQCACLPPAGGDADWYSCGDRDCESGYRYKLIEGNYVPVGPWCAKVNCHGACNPVAPPVGFYGPVCSCF